MRVLVIYDPQNTFVESLRRFKIDGNEFKLQANTCISFYRKKDFNVFCHKIEGKNAFDKRQNLFRSLECYAEYGIKFDRIINFTHGAKYNLNRKMISMANIGKFADKLKAIASDQCKIVLFSCWTGAVEDGFANKLSELTGFNVIAHKTRGHTTRNPNKVLCSQFFFAWAGTIKSLALLNGGIKALKNSLNQSPAAPFEFVEEVFNGK